jgi:hypothetical protein
MSSVSRASSSVEMTPIGYDPYEVVKPSAPPLGSQPFPAPSAPPAPSVRYEDLPVAREIPVARAYDVSTQTDGKEIKRNKKQKFFYAFGSILALVGAIALPLLGAGLGYHAGMLAHGWIGGMCGAPFGAIFGMGASILTSSIGLGIMKTLGKSDVSYEKGMASLLEITKKTALVGALTFGAVAVCPNTIFAGL